MTSFRIREYGQPDWTELDISGDLETEIAEAVGMILRESDHWHVQVEGAAGWGDLEEVDLEVYRGPIGE